MSESKNQGIKNFKSKLAEIEVVEIYWSDLPQRDIAEKYSISQSLVSRIKLRKLWRHLPLPEPRYILK